MTGVALWLLVILVLLLASVGFVLAASRSKEREARAGAEREVVASQQPLTGNLSLAAQIIAHEKAAWEATKNKDKSRLAALLADDYKEVSNGGVRGKAETLGMLDEGFIAGYWLDDVRVAEHDKQVAVITYKVRIEGIYKGQHVPAKPFYTTSIWMNRDGRWQAVLTWAPS